MKVHILPMRQLKQLEKMLWKDKQKTKTESSAKEVIERFMVSKIQEDKTLAESFLIENAKKSIPSRNWL